VSRIDGWEWGNRGVDLYVDHLTWFEKEGPVRFASGAACDQTLDDFVARGPWDDGVPADIRSEVDRAVRDLEADRAPR
jgi:hypothetical protein